MLVRAFILFIFCTLSQGCSMLVLGGLHLHAHKAKSPPPHIVVKNPKLPDFNQVEIMGKVDVNLHTGYAKSGITLKGDPRDLEKLKISVVDHKLIIHINLPNPSFAHIVVDVRTRYLNYFGYRGQGLIKGQHMHSGLLDLKINNKGRAVLGDDLMIRRLELKGPGYTEINGIRSPYLQLYLSGKAHLKLNGLVKLSTLDIQGGGGWLGLYWVKSDRLTIRARKGAFIQLAGIAKVLDLELWGDARFNGRYLRAYRTFVKTHDNSIAEITTLGFQHTLSTGSSDIRYYKMPKYISGFMALNGATLDLRDWSRPIWKDSDY